MFISVIITAGGSGKRFGGKTKKQFLTIKGKPILFYTIENFYNNPQIDEIIISLPENSEEYKKQILKSYPEKPIRFANGGKERQDSVYNALLQCNPKTDYVMIHDGVRIFLTDKEIDMLLSEVITKKKVILAKKINDTIKKVNNGKIIGTVDRKPLFSALTPQVFDYNLILNLHKKANLQNRYFTDDAALCEYFGEDVFIVETFEFNIKITTPADLLVAEKILRNLQ